MSKKSKATAQEKRLNKNVLWDFVGILGVKSVIQLKLQHND